MKRKYITLKIPKPTLCELVQLPFVFLVGSVVLGGLFLAFCILVKIIFGIQIINI